MMVHLLYLFKICVGTVWTTKLWKYVFEMAAKQTMSHDTQINMKYANVMNIPCRSYKHSDLRTGVTIKFYLFYIRFYCREPTDKMNIKNVKDAWPALFPDFNSSHPLFTKFTNCWSCHQPRKDGSLGQACLLWESNTDLLVWVAATAVTTQQHRQTQIIIHQL